MEENNREKVVSGEDSTMFIDNKQVSYNDYLDSLKKRDFKLESDNLGIESQIQFLKLQEDRLKIEKINVLRGLICSVSVVENDNVLSGGAPKFDRIFNDIEEITIKHKILSIVSQL